MLHKDILDTMTIDEIIDLATAEYSTFFSADVEFEVKHASDGAGRQLEFHVADEESATFLRKELPTYYNGSRTIVMYRTTPKDDEDGYSG
jgi:hypothetical protein|tara:strand:+ start:1248 stop:1517 length:270 start_codon:yes stop_codon:yes gene_type:complete